MFWNVILYMVIITHRSDHNRIIRRRRSDCRGRRRLILNWSDHPWSHTKIIPLIRARGLLRHEDIPWNHIARLPDAATWHNTAATGAKNRQRPLRQRRGTGVSARGWPVTAQLRRPALPTLPVNLHAQADLFVDHVERAPTHAGQGWLTERDAQYITLHERTDHLLRRGGQVIVVIFAVIILQIKPMVKSTRFFLKKKIEFSNRITKCRRQNCLRCQL